MAGAMENDAVQVIVESSWTVVQGSLDSCVTVVFLDPASQEPAIPSSTRAAGKLVMVPPSETVPCEITVKFQGRLCHVQSFYLLSTACICELYSRAKFETDPEYICTVKGWIPDDDISSPEMVSASWEVENVKGRNGLHTLQSGNMSSVGGLTNALNTIRSEDDNLERSVYSSGEGSWVEVKVSGSSSGESLLESLTVLECDGRHVDTNQDESGHFENQSFMCSSRPIISKATGVEINTEHDACSEEKVQSVEHIVPCDVHQQEMYESELELIDHSPWAALTIRLLSLRDKSQVEIDQMVFLAVAGPAPEPASPHQSAERGANHALLAMFIPSMLQMARGISNSRHGEESSSSDTHLIKFGTNSRSCERAPDMMDRLVVEKDVGVFACENAPSEEENTLDLPAHVYDFAACAVSRTDSILKSEGSDQRNMQQGDANGAGLRRVEESGEQPLQPDINVLSRCECLSHLCDTSNGFLAKDLFHTLETFSERFDRLESLCVRMESYLQRTVERLDQRITLLEVKYSRASGDTAPAVVSLQKSCPSVDATLGQKHHTAEPSLSSSLQYPSVSALSPGSESKVGVSSALTESTKHDHLGTQDIPEALNPLLNDIIDTVESGCSVSKNVVRQASSGTQALATGPTTPPRMVDQSRKFCPSLDDAWTAALSAFASSHMPVVDVKSEDLEDTLKCLGVHQSSCPPGDASTSRPQDCKTFKEKQIFSGENSHADVDSDAEFIYDIDSEVVNSDYGPTSEDSGCLSDWEKDAQSSCYIWTSLPQAYPKAVLKRKEDKQFPCHSLDLPISMLHADSDCILLKEAQGISRKRSAAGTEADHPHDDVDSASTEELLELKEDTQLCCPQFDVFASVQRVDSDLTLFKEAEDFPVNISATASGVKNGASPVFDSSACMQQASIFSFDNSKSKSNFYHHIIDTVYNSSIHCQEKGDLSLSGGKIPENLYSLIDDASDGDAIGVWFRPLPSKFGEHNASCSEGRVERTLDDSNDHAMIDWLSFSPSAEPRMVVSTRHEALYSRMNTVNLLTTSKPLGGTCSSFINKTPNLLCEVEEATSSPDLLGENSSKYQDNKAGSEDSLWFSQDFDTYLNDLYDEWSSAQNIFHLQDPDITNDETNSQVVDLEQNFVISDSNLLGKHFDTGFTQDPLIWPSPHDAKRQHTTVLPGFDNFS